MWTIVQRNYHFLSIHALLRQRHFSTHLICHDKYIFWFIASASRWMICSVASQNVYEKSVKDLVTFFWTKNTICISNLCTKIIPLQKTWNGNFIDLRNMSIQFYRVRRRRKFVVKVFSWAGKRMLTIFDLAFGRTAMLFMIFNKFVFAMPISSITFWMSISNFSDNSSDSTIM